jgi:hypothetical protein
MAVLHVETTRKHCRIDKAIILSTGTRSLLLMFCCCDVHYSRHIMYQRMEHNVEYSFVELTDIVLLYRESECNSATPAYLYTGRCPQWWHANHGTLIFLEHCLQETGCVGPSMAYASRPRSYGGCWCARRCFTCFRTIPCCYYQAVGPSSAHFPAIGAEDVSWSVVISVPCTECLNSAITAGLWAFSAFCEWLLQWDGSDSNLS